MKNTIIIVILFLLTNTLFATRTKVDKAKEAQAKAWAKNQQLEFIENKGQFTNTDGKPADNVLFKASYGNCDIYITDNGLSYVFVKIEEKDDDKDEIKDKKPRFGIGNDDDENKIPSYYRLDMDLVGATIDKTNIIKEDESKQGHYNYFYPHCPEGIYDVKGYGKITIKNIYKGIDWVIYTNPNNKEHPLKYDFVVHPNADYKDIKIKYLNAQNISLIDNNTKLKIQTIAGNIEEGNIYTYQKDSNEIKSKYVINKDSIISFEINIYDKTQSLIIDPLVWATYYGGSGGDFISSICVDSHDNIYITGSSGTTDFPLQQLAGAYWQGNSVGGGDIVILKFNNLGVRLWATYYGGNNDDGGQSICSDSYDNIYISGSTESTNFPVQQLSGAYWQANNVSLASLRETMFILKFNDQGVRLWATYYGGDGEESADEIIVDSQDNLFIVGSTTSFYFPTQYLTGAYWQPNRSCNIGTAFILKFNSQCVRQWATYYGGSDMTYFSSICLDSLNNIYITGYTYSNDFPNQQLAGAYWQPTLTGGNNCIILKFNNNGVRLWATYYGAGSEDGFSICLDSQENIYITGITESTNFPTQQLFGAYWQSNLAGNIDAFILKFNKLGVREWATYYGGSGNDVARSIRVDKEDNIYIVGDTYSNDFPTQQLNGEYWQATNLGFDATFILKFQNQGIRQWATYYGGSMLNNGTNIAVDHQNYVYVIGDCWDSCLFTKDYGNGAYYQDSLNNYQDDYILKIAPCNNRKPISLQSNRNNICLNDTTYLTLTAIGGIGDTLKWFTGGCGQNYIGKDTILIIPPPTQTTTFYARWESSCDTSACDSIIINVHPIEISNLNPVICQGEVYNVGVHSYNITGIYKDTLTTYLGCDSIITTNLTVNPTKQTTQNHIMCQGEVFNVGSHSYNITGIYKDTLTTYLGCDSIITTNLTVNPTYNIVINKVICQGQSYQVDTNNYIKTGTYVDSLITYLGCDSIITTNLIVVPPPIVNLGNDTTLCYGQSLLLDASYQYASCLWQDNTINPTYNIIREGIYWVTVSIDSYCFVRDTINISYQDCEGLFFIPNSFTPNGDGLNDVFKIKTVIEISEFKLVIYDRWGEMIFESDDINKGWDGTYKGKAVPFDVYIYQLTVTIKNTSNQIKKTGRVTVVR